MVEITLVLDNVRSSYNVGSIARSSDAFGVSRIIAHGITPYPLLPNDTRLPHISDKATRQIHKTALDAEQLITHHTETFAELLKLLPKQPLICLEQHVRSEPLQSFSPPSALTLVVGNEVSGVGGEFLEHADHILEVAMLGSKESLNVAVSSAIALYHLQHPMS